MVDAPTAREVVALAREVAQKFGSIGVERFPDRPLIDEARAYIERHKADVSIMALAYIQELSTRLEKRIANN